MKHFTVGCFLAFLSFIFLSCEQKSSEPKNSPQKSILNVAMGEEPDSLDWQLAKSISAGILNINLMRGLYKVNTLQEKLKVEKDLLTSVTPVSKTSMRFCIDTRVKWSDGVALKVEDFISAWQRLLAPETASASAHRLFFIKGAKKFNQGKISFKKVGLRKVDSQCFLVEAEHSFDEFELLFSAPYTFPIRKDLIDSIGKDYFLPPHSINLGFYSLAKEQTPGQTLLNLKQEYKNKSPFDQVKVFWLNHEKVGVDLFRKKQLDLVLSPTLQGADKDLQSSFETLPAGSLYFLVFNFRNEIVKNKDFRNFVRQSIDKEKLLKSIHQNFKMAEGLIPWFFYDEKLTPLPPFKKILPVDIKPLEDQLKKRPLTLFTNTDPLNRSVMEAIQYQLKTQMQVPTKIETQNSASYFQALKQGDHYSLFRLTWTPALPTPAGFLELFDPNAKNKFLGADSKKLNQLFLEFHTESNKTKKNQLARQIEAWLLHEEVAVIPLFWKSQDFLVNKEKIIFRPHFTNRIHFSNIHLK